MRPKVYIAGGITLGDLAHNIRQASQAAIFLIKNGFAPFCPHWSVYASGPSLEVMGQVLAVAERLPAGTVAEDWYEADLPWVAASNALIRLPGESRGADLEVACALEHNVPVYHGMDEFTRSAFFFTHNREWFPDDYLIRKRT